MFNPVIPVFARSLPDYFSHSNNSQHIFFDFLYGSSFTDQCSETLFQKQFEPKLHTFSIKQFEVV